MVRRKTVKTGSRKPTGKPVEGNVTTPRSPLHSRKSTPVIKSSTSSKSTLSKNLVRSRSSVSSTSAPRTSVKHFRPGMKALQEIRKLQKTTHLLIPRLPFQRLVKQLLLEWSDDDQYFRISRGAVESLQEACESYMTQFFEDSLLCTLHAKRVTLMARDMQLARRLRGRQDLAN